VLEDELLINSLATLGTPVTVEVEGFGCCMLITFPDHIIPAKDPVLQCMQVSINYLRKIALIRSSIHSLHGDLLIQKPEFIHFNHLKQLILSRENHHHHHVICHNDKRRYIQLQFDRPLKKTRPILQAPVV